PCAKTCASLVVRLKRELVFASDSVPIFTYSGCHVVTDDAPGIPENNVVSHAALLRGMRLHAKVVRSTVPSNAKAMFAGNEDWTRCKLAQSAGANFELHTTW